MSAVPQINVGKTPEQHLNIIHLLPLPADTPFGNMALKHTMLIQRFDHINLLIREIFATYESAKNLDNGRITRHLLLAEELVYWLRKTADELIGLLYMLSTRETTGTYPTKLPALPIASVKKTTPAWAVPHVEFLTLLGELSNAYKHSFFLSDLSMIGRDEPVLYTLAHGWNDLTKPPTFHNVRVRDVVERFDAFFQSVRQVLKASKLPHRDG